MNNGKAFHIVNKVHNLQDWTWLQWFVEDRLLKEYQHGQVPLALFSRYSILAPSDKNNENLMYHDECKNNLTKEPP